jgi:methenyltetrahydromethanopterin cyclohydrolase
LESSDLPIPQVAELIARDCRVEPDHVALLVAPTASQAGNLQVVARSVETAMHKLFELGFDVTRVDSACGSAPVPPVAADDLTGIGRTNDAILYGGRVTLWVDGDDESIREIGPRVPSSGSPLHGRPFLELFEAAGRDFYKMDPLLFSPAEVVFQNVATGRVHHFGRVNEDVLRQSFGF